MTTLPDRDTTALLVIDVQNGVVNGATRRDAVVANIAVLISDAHTTEDLSAWGAPPPEQVIAHTNLYWTQQQAPGRTAGTVASGDVTFA